MGIINVTPDSFSDGGEWFDTDDAIAHGLRLLAEGADILDVGGESTRPGAHRPPVAEELRRVIPVVRALAAAGAVVSVDTMRHDVARAAVMAGAAIVNDVSGGLADERMLATVAELQVPYVLMHWRAHSATMQQVDQLRYDDVVTDVRAELSRRVDAATAAGIPDDRIICDPGIGFSKTADHNWALLRGIDRLAELGLPILIGVSRKSFLGAALADDAGPRPVTGRDDASVAITTWCAERRLWGVRTHTVRPHRDAVDVAELLRQFT